MCKTIGKVLTDIPDISFVCAILIAATNKKKQDKRKHPLASIDVCFFILYTRDDSGIVMLPIPGIKRIFLDLNDEKFIELNRGELCVCRMGKRMWKCGCFTLFYWLEIVSVFYFYRLSFECFVVYKGRYAKNWVN